MGEAWKAVGSEAFSQQWLVLNQDETRGNKAQEAVLIKPKGHLD